MKFTVTPLGGGRADTARVVDSIVRYLNPPAAKTPGAGGPAPSGAEGAEQYYADKGEEPGRWLGRYAATTGLAGPVQRHDFASVLAGRDPHTGERLITAQGSAGRRPTLGAGAHSRTGAHGERLYDVADAAAVLGVTHREVERLLDAGTRLALAALAPAAGHDSTGYPVGEVASEPGASYLVPIVEQDGSRWMTEDELSRCQQARDEGVSPEQVLALGGADDQLTISEAARLAGVTNPYLRWVARYHEDHQVEIAQSVAAGRQPRRAYLEAHRAPSRLLIAGLVDLLGLVGLHRRFRRVGCLAGHIVVPVDGAAEEVLEGGCGLGLHARQDVLVHVHGERDVGVAEAFADDLHGDALLEQDRGVGVAEVVKSDLR